MLVHQHLENEAEGKVDAVEWANAPVGGAQQHFAVQQDGSVHQVQTEEHQHRQQQVHVQQGLAVVAGNTEWVWGRGVKMESHFPIGANRMYGTDQELQSDHKNSVAGHGNTPVHLAVVDDKQLKDEAGQ